MTCECTNVIDLDALGVDLALSGVDGRMAAVSQALVDRWGHQKIGRLATPSGYVLAFIAFPDELRDRFFYYIYVAEEYYD